MKKMLLLLLGFLLVNQFVSGQTGKTVLAILPFKSDYNAGSTADQQSIVEMVTQAFVTTSRFNIYDNDRIRQSISDSIPPNALISDFSGPAFIRLGKALGIEYFILGNIKNISTKSTVDVSNNRSFTGHVIFSLKLISVASGEIGEVKTFDSYGAIGGYVNLSYDSEQAAILKSIQGMKKQVTKFIEENFPIIFHIIDIPEKKGGEAVKIQLMGGESMGLTKNEKLQVLQITTINFEGKTLVRKKVIGSVKVIDVQGDDISEAKVVDGGEAILKAFEADPKSVVCKTD
jgi:hypothetical protein